LGSLGFFVDIILLAVLWPWHWLSFWQKSVLGVSSGVKAAGACSWQPRHLHMPIV